MKYILGKKASALLGIHQNTLRKYADRGIIPSFKTASGQRRYDVDAYLNQQPDIQTVCYYNDGFRKGPWNKLIIQEISNNNG